MMDDALQEKILKAAEIGETTDWEFKSAKGGLPHSFWETYSAMANTDGGTVVLGAKEKQGVTVLEGLFADQISRHRKNLWDDLHNRSKVSCNLLSNRDIQEVTVEGKTLLIVNIRRASRTERPIYLTPVPFGHTYSRCHEGDYLCSDEEVRRMLADADPIPADQKILDGFSLEDLDRDSIDQYLRRFSIAKPNHPWLSLPIKELLETLGGWRRDRTTGKEGLTVAGLLMFGRHRSITAAEALPRFFVDYQEKLESALRWSHRLYPDGTWEANLFQFYQRIWPRLASDLQVPFRLEKGIRIDETAVHQALREALVNSLIHADYMGVGGVVIERYTDRFVLGNPGSLLVSLEQLRRGGISECRNKALQQMFLMIGGGEKAGSGFSIIQKEWKAQHWRAPSLTSQHQPERVRLELPMVSLIPDDILRFLQQRFGESFRLLNQFEVQALVTASIEGEVSNVRLQELLNHHSTDITQILKGLCEKGMLKSDNRRRWSRYRLSDGGVPSLAGDNEGGVPSFGGGVPSFGGGVPSLAEVNEGGVPSFEGEVPSLPHLKGELYDLAKRVALMGKVSQSVMQSTILQLCEGRFLTPDQLSQLLNRGADHLQRRYLGPMVSEGLLSMRYPDAPNRPGQEYTKRGK